MTKQARPDALGDLAASVLVDNEAIRARVFALVDGLLSSAEYTVRYGTPSERAQLMRAIVPPLLKAIQNAEAGTGDDAKAQAYKRMLGMMTGETPS